MPPAGDHNLRIVLAPFRPLREEKEPRAMRAGLGFKPQ